jgi:ABC-type multidrug transport system ATPase subunit
MIQIRDLAAAYGSLRVLSGLSLDVRAGERVALIGPNGVGKTTLLRCLLGQVRYTGKVVVGGIDVARNGARARRLIGYVPQSPAFPQGMQVREVIAFFQRLRGRPAQPAAVLERAGLTGAAEHPAASLSGGMLRRLTLAVALIDDPPLLLLDEPAAGLDPEGEANLYRWLHDLRCKGVTVVLTAHQFRTLQNAADRVVMLRAGGVAFDQPLVTMKDARRFTLVIDGPTQDVRALRERLAGDVTIENTLNGALHLSLLQRDLARVLSRLDGAALSACHVELREAGLDEAIDRLLTAGSPLRDAEGRERDR